MVYFEYHLAAQGVHAARRISILRTNDDTSLYRDLKDELLEVFPEAEVSVDAPGAPAVPSDLLVIPLPGAYRFPLHDVVYEHLDLLDRVRRRVDGTGHVMIYRVNWRQIEVVPARAIPALVRRRRLERALIGGCTRLPLLRRLLHPRFPN